MFDTSVLDRVKKRLQNDQPDDGVSDTQIIPGFGTSILFGNTTIPDEQPLEGPSEQGPRSPQAIRLPQLPLDESDFYKPTQVIAPANDFAFSSTQVIAEQTQKDDLGASGGSIEDAQPKASQSTTLAAELTHTSLTDEENDLNDDADTTLDSSVQKTVTTKAELEKIEQDLGTQKRLKNIQPGFAKKASNPIKQLLDAFQSDSDNGDAMSSEKNIHSTPSTSPINAKVPPANDMELSSDSDFEIDVMDLIANVPKKSPQKKKLSPIEEYAEKLKKQLNSSPTKPHNDVIVLDDSDADRSLDSADNDDIPKLTKEQAFVIRSKFSRRKANVHSQKFQGPAHAHGNSLFNELRRANARQLLELKQNNPDSELIEEIEKEEEEMGNLLEREMERVRRIRKKEKLLEKAQKALLDEKSDGDYDDNQGSEHDNGSEVPDSDVGSADYDSGENEESGSDSEPEAPRHERARARRVVLSDDEEELGPAEGSLSRKSNVAADERIDDSYMFGGSSKESGVDESEDPVMQIQSAITRPDSPVTSNIEKPTQLRSDSHTLFSNLPPPATTQESSHLESAETMHEPVSFQENSTQNDGSTYLATQVDGPLLNATSTQDDRVLPTQEDEYSDDDDDLHSAIDRGRRRIRENSALVKLEDEPEVDEEDLKRQLALFEAKIRQKELKARKLRKEMERKGMKGIVEGEAEESDDEWKGIGGMDKEDSDQANSEDERMIDNNFNIDLNDEEVRKKFMEQYHIKDRHDLEKLVDDIKNHRLTKRSRSNRFDIELSDEEDEILMAYRRQKLEEQKQRLLENQKMMQSTKSEKTKAFFDCIQEEPNTIVIPESDLSDDESQVSEKDSADDAPHNDSDGERPPKKKVLEESFVQKQLSFLCKTEEDDYFAMQQAADIQHGVDDGIEDVSSLKEKCLSNLYSRPGSSENIGENRKRPQEAVLTDDDEDGFPQVFKRPSMVSSFRSFRDKHAAQVSTNSFSGVTVNKHYKVASASTASITYMSKNSKNKTAAPSFKSSKAKEIEDRVDRAKLESGVFRSRDNFA